MTQQQIRPLPKRVDVARHSQHGLVVTGTLALSELPRLATVLGDNTAQVIPVLRFGVDDEGRRIANCRMKASLRILCQRCLELMPFDLDSDLDIAFVATDSEAKHLPSHLEPALLLEGSSDVDLYGMLEDELLLGLPLAAYHESCSDARVVGADGGNNEQVNVRPFAGLAALLSQKSGKQ